MNFFLKFSLLYIYTRGSLVLCAKINLFSFLASLPTLHVGSTLSLALCSHRRHPPTVQHRVAGRPTLSATTVLTLSFSPPPFFISSSSSSSRHFEEFSNTIRNLKKKPNQTEWQQLDFDSSGFQLGTEGNCNMRWIQKCTRRSAKNVSRELCVTSANERLI